MASPELQLPFNQGWWVVDGVSETAALNFIHPTQRHKFAVDFIIKDALGSDHAGDPAENESYYCYGKDIAATEAGEVVAVHRDVPDNTPSNPNTSTLLGNYVVVRHHAELTLFSLFAHLRNKSIVVEAGMDVGAGQKIATCGNSGHSFAPHLSYTLLDDSESATYRSGTIEVVPSSRLPSFRRVAVMSKLGSDRIVKRYTPQPSDRIRNAA